MKNTRIFSRPIIKLLPLILFFTLLVSCEDFEIINTNPNAPVEVRSELFLPDIIRSTSNQMVGNAGGIGNMVMQHMMATRNTGTDQYSWTSFNGVWNNGYSNLRNVYELEKNAIRNEEPNYEGIALVLKTLIFSRLTDSYGDIPYFDAIKGMEGIYTPAYDTQEQIYAAMIEDLKRANELLDPASGSVFGDILYNGDLYKWKKFANSLRLRLLLRQSAKVDVSSEINQIFSNPTQYPIFESNADQAALTYLSTPPNLFPRASTRAGDFVNDRRLSETLVNWLNNTNDPRIKAFARPTGPSVANFEAGTGDLQYVGLPNGQPTELLSSAFFTQASLPGRIIYIEQDIPVRMEGLIMTYSELLFIRAESALKEWISENPAESYYSAIQASIDYYNLIDDENDISVNNSFYEHPKIAFNSSSGLEQIIRQKWVAFFYNGLQGWFEWKRTGLPELQPAIENVNNNRIPVRFQYPDQQQVLNRAAYEAAVSRQGPDDINTPIWWMP